MTVGLYGIFLLVMRRFMLSILFAGGCILSCFCVSEHIQLYHSHGNCVYDVDNGDIGANAETVAVGPNAGTVFVGANAGTVVCPNSGTVVCHNAGTVVGVDVGTVVEGCVSASFGITLANTLHSHI